MDLFLATANPHKLEEVAEILEDLRLPVNLFSAAALGGMPPVEENGATYAANARLKALALAALAPAGAWLLADDTGLEVEALRGRPGLHSARYAGPEARYADNNARLLAELAGLPPEGRAARFLCCLVLLGPEERPVPVGGACAWSPDLAPPDPSSRSCREFLGTCPGRILEAARGGDGFGYDPLFLPDGCENTFAQMPGREKNRLSHRARALAALAEWLHSRPDLLAEP